MEESENGSEKFADIFNSPYDGEHPSTSLDFKSVSCHNQFSQSNYIQDIVQESGLENNFIDINTNHDQTTADVTSTVVGIGEGGCEQEKQIRDFVGDIHLENKEVNELNREIKTEAETNLDGGRVEELLETSEGQSSLPELKLKGGVGKDPELFVTFEKQVESIIETSRENESIMETSREKESNTDTTREEVSLNSSLHHNEVREEATNLKQDAEELETGMEKKEKSKSLSNEEENVVGKRKRGRKPKKKQKPDFLEIQMVKHPLLPPCQCNKRKCHENFSLDMRSHIHDRFWVMNMYERREWLKEHLLYCKPKSRTNHPVSTLHESHRKFFLPNQSEKIEVCRRMFFSTLGFKDEAKFLQNPKLLNKQGMLSRTRKRKCVMSRTHLNTVKEYCNKLAEQHGNPENPGTSAEVVIPSGFSLRDMYNDFCIKRSTNKFGYHRFRQILELLLRGGNIEDYEFADLREDDDDNVDDVSCSKSKDSVAKKSKEKEITDDYHPSRRKKKKHNRKKSKEHSPKKNKTILKLPLYSNLKHTISNKNKRKRIEAFPNSAPNKRYNFRESINVLSSYSEDHLMESAIDSVMESYNDDEIDDDNYFVDDKKDKDYYRTLKVKHDSQDSPVKKKLKNKRKENKYLDAIKKSKQRKPRKLKLKSELRLAQIAYTESRRKSASNHPILSPCNCNFRKCVEKIPESQRQIIHTDFWSNPTKQEKRQWIQQYIKHCKPRSRSTTIKFPRKHLSKKYFFPNEAGELFSVCRVFFMRTLGYHSNMTLDSMDMTDSGLELLAFPDEMPSENTDVGKNKRKDTGSSSNKETTIDKSIKDKESPSKEVRTELSSETGNMEEVICKDEMYDNQSDEGNEDQEEEESVEKNIFFTPDVEREEIEKAVSSGVKRRRPLSLRNSKEHHPMGLPCSCAKKCSEKFPHDRRVEIHEHYWSLITYNQRKQWILDNITREVPKRRTVLNHPVRKKETRKCFLINSEGNKLEVCRAFFLSTLGFKWDKMIDTICKTTPQGSKYVRADLRGRRPPIHKIPDDVTECIREYLESILKTIPFIPPAPKHSQKSKKPKKKKTSTAPVPIGLTIKSLFADYKAKHPHQKVSYASFRKVHCHVRDIVKAQNPDLENEEENGSAPVEILEPHSDNMPASPGSDDGFGYIPNNMPNNNNVVPTTISPLQSCMYNDQPQLLNLSSHHLNDAIPKNTTPTNQQPHRLGLISATGSSNSSGGSNKFSKAQQQVQDFHHLLPFSGSSKGHGGMYPIPGHSSSNLMAPYSSAQPNPLDPFYMASSSTQGISNPIAYSNLHFPTDLIGHHHHLPPPPPHHHHPAHHHPHLYQSHLPYHNRFPGNVLPQALKDHDPSNHHNFYNPQMDFNQDHHPENMFQPFKDALNYPSFTPDNLSTHSPVQHQIPNQIAFPGNNSINIHEHRNTVGNFAEDMSMNNTVPGATSSDNIQASGKEGQLAEGGPAEHLDLNQTDKVRIMEVLLKEKNKRPRSRKKKSDKPPKEPRVKKGRPLSNRNSKEHHPMLPACTCGKKCFDKILQEQREVIYEAFWDLGNYSSRKQWIAEHMKREDPKRRTNLEAPVMRKKETRRFTLPTISDTQIEVCRLFFLHTLGLKWDKIIGTICKTTARDEHITPPDMRGRKTPAHTLNEEVKSSVDEYTRGLLQAAKPEFLANQQLPDNPRKYSLDTFIPYGLNMRNLHQDYKAKHASHKISYETFRKIFRQVRKEVLDPDSSNVEDKEEKPDTAKLNSTDNTEEPQGTINATTGHIDTVDADNIELAWN